MFWTNYERYCKSISESPNAVAAACGVKSSGTVTGWRNGSQPRPQMLDTIIKYLNSKGLNISAADFFGEEDTKEKEAPSNLTMLQSRYMALDSYGKQAVDAVLDAEYDRCAAQPEKIVYIRHYLSSPAAGVDGLVSGEDYEDIPLPPTAPRGADFCVNVSGDSMMPYLSDGQMIYVKRDAPIQDFDVAVVTVDGGLYVKQIARSYDGSLYLLSANPKREDANITIDRDSNHSVQFWGKVLLPRRLPQPVYE